MAKPSQKDIEAALTRGEPLPGGDYAVDWSRGGIVRELTADEKAAAKKDQDEVAAGIKERGGETAPPAGAGA